MGDKYNLIISSKNRSSDETISNFTVRLEKPIVVSDNEYLTVNMTQFNCIKSFYAVQYELNSDYNIIIKLNGVVDQEIELFIPEGNYDVYTLKDYFNHSDFIFNEFITAEYSERLNRFIFKNKYSVGENEEYEVYLKCINSGVFFGMENGVEMLITELGTYSTKFINVSGYESLIIQISGGLEIDNSITNINNKTFQHSKVLAIINVNDITPMDSIIYNNMDGGINFSHKVHNRIIEYFTISITNEDGTVFPQMADYLMTLQFTKHIDNNYLKTIDKKLEDIAYFITAFIEKSGMIDDDD